MGPPVFRSCPRRSAPPAPKQRRRDEGEPIIRLANWRSSKQLGENSKMSDGRTSASRHLTPETLHQLVQRRGFDACVELVTAATPAQLTSRLDLDLWCHTQPGRDEQFDVDRFGGGSTCWWTSVAARTVAALDEHLLILGLSRSLRVFDPGTFEPTESSDDEPIDHHNRMNSETSRDVVECDVAGYLVRARRTDAWDAIVALLGTLEIEHNHYFPA
jgi:hypothetical protein